MTSVYAFFSKTLSLTVLGLAALLPFSAQAQNTYETLPQAQPTDTPGKVEVLEFFAYSCPHCATIEPMVAEWKKDLPENVVVRQVPVAFNASMEDLQRLYYALEALGRLDLHPKVFDAIHDERKRIFTEPAIADWIETQGVKPDDYRAAARSFGVTSKVARAKELEEAYDIQGTPTLAVGGKYVTSPSMTGSYQGTITQAQKLVDQVLSAQ
ncbi:MAG: thiol:disulfide interchange protein [Pusillimonas sp.]|nr:thiol:disulfide interchange protein [Pusillimonas sp.]